MTAESTPVGTEDSDADAGCPSKRCSGDRSVGVARYYRTGRSVTGGETVGADAFALLPDYLPFCKFLKIRKLTYLWAVGYYFYIYIVYRGV